MVKVLILGANGMLGHKLFQVLSDEYEVFGTIRGDYEDIKKYGIFPSNRIATGVNALDFASVKGTIERINPEVVINCVGLIKQRSESKERLLSIKINALLPHQLLECCNRSGIRLIHFSTDCVFSGEKGDYAESEQADADDVYGRTKYLGELDRGNSLTIRTSIIGRELSRNTGLVEWLFSNKGGMVSGFQNVVFSGFPNLLA